MSELTPCNRCTLEGMQERAARRGVTVILAEDDGWTSARYSDQEEPSAWFLELPDSCAC